MPTDVIVLAGGRSSRLGGVAKASLLLEERTLLQRAVDTARTAGGRIVVVGPDASDAAADTMPAVQYTRERPAFGGPAAAIAAGMVALRSGEAPPAALIAVLACDMPFAAPAFAAVLEAALGSDGTGTDRVVDGWVAADASGRTQQLLAVYRASSLERRIATLQAERASEGIDGLTDLAVRHLVAGLDLRTVEVPAGGADDVDTWADADRLGVTRHPDASDEGAA